MYIKPVGSTEADIPDIAGNLTIWHDHQNLCWDEKNPGQVVGVTQDGVCAPGSVSGRHRRCSTSGLWTTSAGLSPGRRGDMTGSCSQMH